MQRRQPPSSHTNSFRIRAIFDPVRQDSIRNYFENCAMSRNASIKYFLAYYLIHYKEKNDWATLRKTCFTFCFLKVILWTKLPLSC